MVEGGLRRRLSAVAYVSAGYQVRAYRGVIDPRIIISDLNEHVGGIRQTASLGFEGMALGRVLLNLKYQFEIDLATRELPRHEPSLASLSKGVNSAITTTTRTMSISTSPTTV